MNVTFMRSSRLNVTFMRNEVWCAADDVGLRPGYGVGRAPSCSASRMTYSPYADFDCARPRA